MLRFQGVTSGKTSHSGEVRGERWLVRDLRKEVTLASLCPGANAHSCVIAVEKSALLWIIRVVEFCFSMTRRLSNKCHENFPRLGRLGVVRFIVGCENDSHPGRAAGCFKPVGVFLALWGLPCVSYCRETLQPAHSCSSTVRAHRCFLRDWWNAEIGWHSGATPHTAWLWTEPQCGPCTWRERPGGAEAPGGQPQVHSDPWALAPREGRALWLSLWLLPAFPCPQPPSVWLQLCPLRAVWPAPLTLSVDTGGPPRMSFLIISLWVPPGGQWTRISSPSGV